MNEKYTALRKELDGWINTLEYPVYDTDKYVDFFKAYPLFTQSRIVSRKVRRVEINKIYGDNWAFQAKEARGRYPSYVKLDALLRGYTKCENNFYNNSKIPPVPIKKIIGSYYLDEGNHRLYMSKLLVRKTILADVTEYDYEAFLRETHLYTTDYESYIIRDGSMNPVSEQEAANYKKLKMLLEKENRR